jgi:hypothetical protein
MARTPGAAGVITTWEIINLVLRRQAMRFFTRQLLQSQGFYWNFIWDSCEEAVNFGNFSAQKMFDNFSDNIFGADEVKNIIFKQDVPVRHLSERDYQKLKALRDKNDSQIDAAFDTASAKRRAALETICLAPDVPLGLKKFSVDTRHDHEAREFIQDGDRLTMTFNFWRVERWCFRIAPGWQAPDWRRYLDDGWLSPVYEEFILLDSSVEYNVLFLVHNRAANEISRKIGALHRAERKNKVYNEELRSEIARLQHERHLITDGYPDEVEMSVRLLDACPEYTLRLEESSTPPTLKAASRVDRFGWRLKGLTRAGDILRFEFDDAEQKRVLLTSNPAKYNYEMIREFGKRCNFGHFLEMGGLTERSNIVIIK